MFLWDLDPSWCPDFLTADFETQEINSVNFYRVLSFFCCSDVLKFLARKSTTSRSQFSLKQKRLPKHAFQGVLGWFEGLCPGSGGLGAFRVSFPTRSASIRALKLLRSESTRFEIWRWSLYRIRFFLFFLTIHIIIINIVSWEHEFFHRIVHCTTRKLQFLYSIVFSQSAANRFRISVFHKVRSPVQNQPWTI